MSPAIIALAALVVGLVLWVECSQVMDDLSIKAREAAKEHGIASPEVIAIIRRRRVAARLARWSLIVGLAVWAGVIVWAVLA